MQSPNFSASNAHQVLGVDVDASLEDITRKYRQLALEHHPDKNLQAPEAAHETFVQINAAYENLATGLSNLSVTEANLGSPQSGLSTAPPKEPFSTTSSSGQTFLTPEEAGSNLSRALSNLISINTELDEIHSFFIRYTDTYHTTSIRTDLTNVRYQILRARTLQEKLLSRSRAILEFGAAGWSESQVVVVDLCKRLRELISWVLVLGGAVGGLTRSLRGCNANDEGDLEEFAEELSGVVSMVESYSQPIQDLKD